MVRKIIFKRIRGRNFRLTYTNERLQQNRGIFCPAVERTARGVGREQQQVSWDSKEWTPLGYGGTKKRNQTWKEN